MCLPTPGKGISVPGRMPRGQLLPVWPLGTESTRKHEESCPRIRSPAAVAVGPRGETWLGSQWEPGRLVQMSHDRACEGWRACGSSRRGRGGADDGTGWLKDLGRWAEAWR